MRNSKVNIMHDAVRRVAVAPQPRPFYRERPTSVHADDPLSENESDCLPRIRSYIKPNKNVNTYNKALREERILFGSKANRSVPRSSMPSASHKPWRSRFSSTKRRENSFSVVTTVSQVHSAFRSRAEVSTKFGFSALNAVGKMQHNSARLSYHEAPTSYCPKEGRIPDTSNKFAVKRRDVPKPKPPPLPTKKSRISSSPINLPLQSQKQSQNRNAGPCSSNIATTTNDALHGKLQPTGQQLQANTERNCCHSDPNSTSSVGCLHRKNSSSGETGAPRSSPGLSSSQRNITWNEPENFVNLVNLRLGIFNLCTLPDEGKWYLDEFPKVARERFPKKNMYDSTGCDLNVTSLHEEPLPSTSTSSTDTILNCNGHSSSSDCAHDMEVNQQKQCSSVSPSFREATRNGDVNTSHQALAPHLLNATLNHLSTLRSCLMGSKKTLRKQVSFSDSISTFFYEASDCEPSQVPKDDDGNFAGNQRDPEIGSEASNLLHNPSSSLPLKPVKVEVEDEDDEVQVLFSGKPEYIEALYRERCGK